jgi:hypothetical protein
LHVTKPPNYVFGLGGCTTACTVVFAVAFVSMAL